MLERLRNLPAGRSSGLSVWRSGSAEFASASRSSLFGQHQLPRERRTDPPLSSRLSRYTRFWMCFWPSTVPHGGAAVLMGFPCEKPC
jgi:hypothetical protein